MTKRLLAFSAALLMSIATLSAQQRTPIIYPAIEVTPEMQAAKDAARYVAPTHSPRNLVPPSCQNLQPVCIVPQAYHQLATSANVTAAHVTNPGNAYACLGSTPNPIWYYLQVDGAGNIDLQLNAQTDIDFIVWGPFPNVATAQAACGNYQAAQVTDCSFSGSNVEDINIPNAQVGEIYVLLITNFSNVAGIATLIQTNGTGTIGCDQFSSISGTIWDDNNNDCAASVGENGLSNLFVQSTYGFAPSNAQGEYAMIADQGTHNVSLIIPTYLQPLLSTTCANAYSLVFGSTPNDTTGIDFFVDALDCPYLTVDVSSSIRRRCMPGRTIVRYCNEGFATANNAQVFVQLPQHVHFVSASALHSIDPATGAYVFNVGNLPAGACGTITIADSVPCINGIMGDIQCVQAWITPNNDCVQDAQPVDPNEPWDRSSVRVNGSCVGGVARFVITNTGSSSNGNMQGTSEYRVYVDGLLVYTGTFQIAGGATLTIDVPATGGVIRLEADQRPNHPGNSRPNDVVTGCGGSGNTDDFADWLAFNSQPTDDSDVHIEEDCLPVVDSYDPNDKQVTPAGIGSTHAVLPNTQLDYTIRFQNTGNAPALRVVIRDTLSAHFDINSLQLGVHSHNYNFYLDGTPQQPILVFDHLNINLIDSASNPLASQGFIKLKLTPRADVPLGTVIENSAAIYFDYNAPIITNTAWITISDPIAGTPIEVSILSTSELQNASFSLQAFPNPTSNSLNIDLRAITGEPIRLSLFSANGQLIQQTFAPAGSLHTLDMQDLSTGIYLLQATNEQGTTTLRVLKK